MSCKLLRWGSLGALLGAFELSWRSLGGSLGLFWGSPGGFLGAFWGLLECSGIFHDMVDYRRPLVEAIRKPGNHASGFVGVSKMIPISPFTARLRLASMVKRCGL